MSDESLMPPKEAVSYALSVMTLCYERVDDPSDESLMKNVAAVTADLTREDLMCVLVAGASIGLGMMELLMPGNPMGMVNALGSNVDAL